MNFSSQQIETLRSQFSGINTVDPTHLGRFHASFSKLDAAALMQISQADIKFVSKLARNECVRRGL